MWQCTKIVRLRPKILYGYNLKKEVSTFDGYSFIVPCVNTITEQRN